MLRRFCGVSATEADTGMPWWERRMLVDGLMREFVKDEEVDGDVN